MRVALCLFKYFPYGGLQRDFLAVANECVRRGHKVRVYVWSWEGNRPEGLEIIVIPISAWMNHRRQQQFVKWVEEHLKKHPVDIRMGFNRMPNLDVYFASDNCYAEKTRNYRWWQRLFPRYKHFIDFEESIFSSDLHTRIVTISSQQIRAFRQYYRTDKNRLVLLPPGIPRDRVAPDNSAECRRLKRIELGLKENELMMIALGSGFKTKGLDRSIRAFAQLPSDLRKQTKLVVVGKDNPTSYRRLAQKLGLDSQVQFLGGRDDVPDLLLAADLLVHPARNEAGGMALLEAAVAGVPVLASEVCGFAHYIKEYDCGELILEPFDSRSYTDSVVKILTSDRREEWRKNGLKMAATADIFDQPQRVVDEIEKQQLILAGAK